MLNIENAIPFITVEKVKGIDSKKSEMLYIIYSKMSKISEGWTFYTVNRETPKNALKKFKSFAMASLGQSTPHEALAFLI